MREPNNGHGRPTRFTYVRINRIFYDHRIFGLYLNVPVPRHQSQHWLARLFFDPADAVIKKIRVPAEPINDKTDDPVLAILRQTRHGSHALRKHTTAMDVSHQDDGRVSVFGHPKIYDIMGSQVHLST